MWFIKEGKVVLFIVSKVELPVSFTDKAQGMDIINYPILSLIMIERV